MYRGLGYRGFVVQATNAYGQSAWKTVGRHTNRMVESLLLNSCPSNQKLSKQIVQHVHSGIIGKVSEEYVENRCFANIKFVFSVFTSQWCWCTVNHIHHSNTHCPFYPIFLISTISRIRRSQFPLFSKSNVPISYSSIYLRFPISIPCFLYGFSISTRRQIHSSYNLPFYSIHSSPY